MYECMSVCVSVHEEEDQEEREEGEEEDNEEEKRTVKFVHASLLFCA